MRLFGLAMLSVTLSASCSAGARSTLRAASDSGQVLGAAAADTVRLEYLPDSTFLRWTTIRNGRRLVRWESRNLYSGIPEVHLANLNEDSAPDLFWSLAYEETIGGTLLLATDTSANVVFASSSAACRLPELKRVTDQGGWAILDYQAAVLSADDCRGNAPMEACHEAFPTEWVVIHALRGDRVVADSSVGKRLYSGLADEYAIAAKSLRSNATKVSCPVGSASKFDEMAARARQIAGG